MPARIRLQRHGKKGMPYYHIVIADGRAPRDGKFIERIGTYNPLAIPAEINLDFEKALNWLQKGAQPSDTAKAILMYKGVIFKNHLLKGVAKGALTMEQAEAKFQLWLEEKEAKVINKKNQVVLTKKEAHKKRMEAEVKVNIAKAEAVAKKRAQELAKEKQQELEAEATEEVAVVEDEVVVAEDAAPIDEVVVSEEPTVIEEATPETDKPAEEPTEEKAE